MPDQAMVKLDPNLCEVKFDGAWIVVSLADAKGRYAMTTKRCSACHGLVSVTSIYSDVVTRPLTLKHRLSHVGCPLMPKIYCGEPSLHPHAIV